MMPTATINAAACSRICRRHDARGEPGLSLPHARQRCRCNRARTHALIIKRGRAVCGRHWDAAAHNSSVAASSPCITAAPCCSSLMHTWLCLQLVRSFPHHPASCSWHHPSPVSQRAGVLQRSSFHTARESARIPAPWAGCTPAQTYAHHAHCFFLCSTALPAASSPSIPWAAVILPLLLHCTALQ